MSLGQMEENSGTIFNIPIYTISVTNMVKQPADSSGLVTLRLKCKLEYRVHVLFESVRVSCSCFV